MKTSGIIITILCITTCAGIAAQQPKTYRKTLEQATEIQGYRCAKGYAWFFADGHLQHCTITDEMPIGEARIPAGSYITLLPDGKPEYAQMSHNAPVMGMTCQGGNFLGPSEGSVVGFYPSGKLKECYLAGDQLVQGVPCSHGGLVATLFGGDPSVHFHESGKLKSCRLSKDFGSLRRGDRIVQEP